MARISYNFWLAAVLLFVTNAVSLGLGAWLAHSDGFKAGYVEGRDAGYANGLGVGMKAGAAAVSNNSSDSCGQ